MADQIFVKVPFALNGDKSPAVPEPLQISGEVSFDQGWPLRYSQDPNTTGLLIERSDMNYLFYLMSLNQKQYQVSGVPLFITTADNGGVPYPYAKNALVLYDAGSGFNIYQSLTNANTALPTVTANWSLIDPYNRLIERNDTALTGTPTVPTKPPLTNSTAAASTAYVDAAIAAAPKMASTPAQPWVRATELYTFAHTLGRVPKSVQLVFFCTANDGGYVIGDIVPLPSGQATEQASADYGYQTKVTASQVQLSIDTNHSLLIHEWNNQSNFNPANSSWLMYFDVIG